tara:strand:+ start:220 stop:1401 length:1182 start_codon:yes stop_codon:yes gene_type:complete
MAGATTREPREAEAVRMLQRGASAAEVLAFLRRERTGPTAYKNAVDRTRGMYMERGARHPEYASKVEAFRQAVAAHGDAKCSAQAELFLAASLPQQVFLLKKYGDRNWSTGSEDDSENPDRKQHCLFQVPDVDKAFRDIHVLPENVAQLKLTPEEYDQIKAHTNKQLEKKNEEAVVVPRAGELLERCRAILRNAAEETMARLVVALLIVSGRRMTEILSWRSSFVAMPTGEEHACIFTGQLKKPKDRPVMPYCIPLLVPFRVFDSARRVLQVKQGPKAAARTNKQHSKYSGNFKETIVGHFGDVLPGAITPHTLRAIYVKMVDEAFDVGRLTVPGLAKRVLGHDDLKPTLHYMYTKLNGFSAEQNTLGPLPCAVMTPAPPPVDEMTTGLPIGD